MLVKCNEEEGGGHNSSVVYGWAPVLAKCSEREWFLGCII